MGAPLLGKHFAELHSASTPIVVVAAVGSLLGQLAAAIQAAPLWVYVLAAVAPWLPIIVIELVWTYRHYRWLAVFCLLLITQFAYLLEQVARMIQLHLLNLDPLAASGVLGAIEPQRVPLAWTTWTFLLALLLVNRYASNRWLWLMLAVAALDAAAPHVGAGLPAEAELVLSVAEAAALTVAFTTQLGRTYDAWLARAFPDLPERLLIDTTSSLREVRLRPGERVAHDGERLYIVTRGKGQLLRHGPGGHEILLSVLGPGQVVRGGGTLVADTTLELLAVPAAVLQ